MSGTPRAQFSAVQYHRRYLCCRPECKHQLPQTGVWLACIYKDVASISCLNARFPPLWHPWVTQLCHCCSSSVTRLLKLCSCTSQLMTDSPHKEVLRMGKLEARANFGRELICTKHNYCYFKATQDQYAKCRPWHYEGFP